MIIKTATFVTSSSKLSQCPPPKIPEFAFIGRSNVGKSSLINMIVNQKTLAKTSSRPGKTQTINHFEVNSAWYLVDLPGYGFASVSQQKRADWSKLMENYFLKRENLSCVFVLIDCRVEPQASDLDFINWLGGNNIPMILVFTKTDKLKNNQLAQSTARFKKKLLEVWNELPPIILSSIETKKGKTEILDAIEKAIEVKK